MEPFVINLSVQDEKLLIVPEIVEKLRCSRNVVLGLIRNGVLPAIKSGREYRVSNLSLIRFIYSSEGQDLQELAGIKKGYRKEAV